MARFVWALVHGTAMLVITANYPRRLKQEH